MSINHVYWHECVCKKKSTARYIWQYTILNLGYLILFVLKPNHPECQIEQWHLFFQVYQLDSGHYVCRNKYYGRSLSIEGFGQALYEFLHNGRYLRKDLFDAILQKLRSLKGVLEKQASYRFYSSSLLIIYDGKEKKLELRQNSAETLSQGNLQDSISSLPSSSSSMSNTENLPNIDLRMIDFAHSTYKGFRDDLTVHDGPDRGYIFGLENLINILEKIQLQNQ